MVHSSGAWVSSSKVPADFLAKEILFFGLNSKNIPWENIATFPNTFFLIWVPYTASGACLALEFSPLVE